MIAAASTQEKLDVSVKLGGADFAVNYTQKDWQKQVMKITGGKGVDVIYDPVGMIRGERTCIPCIRGMDVRDELMLVFADCLKCIAWKGRALVVGFAGGEIEKVR